MNLIRYQKPLFYNPVASHVGLLDEMDRWFDLALPSLTYRQGEFPIDLYQEKDAFVIRAELPGFRKEDLDIEVKDDVLTITGRYVREPAKDGETVREERQITRAVSLPDEVEATRIEAGYENGVLTVKLPKREETKPRQVAITVK